MARSGLASRAAPARSAGLEFQVKRQKVPDWYTARRVAEMVYGFKAEPPDDPHRGQWSKLVLRGAVTVRKRRVSPVAVGPGESPFT